jgi:hypothetical protein
MDLPILHGHWGRLRYSVGGSLSHSARALGMASRMSSPAPKAGVCAHPHGRKPTPFPRGSRLVKIPNKGEVKGHHFSRRNRRRVSEGGFEPPTPGSLPGRGSRPAMSPVLYRAEPLRQGTDAPSRVLQPYAAEASPPSATGATASGAIGTSGIADGSGIGRSSAIVPSTSDRRISIFFSG